MSFTTALRAHLQADPGIGQIVHWNTRPQGSAFPAVVLQVISEDTLRDLEGATGKKSARVQFHCMATLYSTAVELRDAVEARIEGSFTVGETTITLQGEPLRFDRGTDTETGFVHKCLVDARLFHNG